MILGDGDGYRLDGVGYGDNPLVQSPHASCAVPHDGKLLGPVALRIWTGLAATVVNITFVTLLIIPYKFTLL